MRVTGIIALVLWLFCIWVPALAAAPRIGVVSARFDDIAKLFDSFRIKYTPLTIADCQEYKNLENLDVLCLPCGVEPPVESSINVVARRYRIQGVDLKREYREISYDQIYENIERFIRDGGTGYFSDYSYKYLQHMAKPFKFFRDFPHAGISGPSDVTIAGDLAAFFNHTRIRLVMTHNGWVALRDTKGEVLARAQFRTPSGKREGPVSARLEIGSGQAYYTSFHSSRWEREYMRFFVYRMAGDAALKRIGERASRWDQDIETTVVDAFLPGEYHRTYAMTMPADTATLYVDTVDDTRFQVDLFNEKHGMVASWYPVSTSDGIVINGNSGEKVRVSIYPERGETHRLYALGIAGGAQFFPYVHIIKWAGAGLLAVIVLMAIWRTWKPRRFSGKERYWREIKQ